MAQPGSCDCGGGGGDVGKRRRRRWEVREETSDPEQKAARWELLDAVQQRPKPEEKAFSNIFLLRQHLRSHLSSFSSTKHTQASDDT